MRSEFNDPDWREAAFGRVRRVCVAAMCVLLVVLAGRAMAACSDWDLTVAESSYTNVLALGADPAQWCFHAKEFIFGNGGVFDDDACSISSTGGQFTGTFSGTTYHYTVVPQVACDGGGGTVGGEVGGAYAMRDSAHTATIVAMLAGLLLVALWVLFG